jgi:hypothetical protein
MDENVDIAAVANSQILRASSLSASATAYAQAMQLASGDNQVQHLSGADDSTDLEEENGRTEQTDV